ncbi:hypothetical protein SCHPADRAFT_711414 [Schizopora paradoxa]|uniref:Uncharacterized protein n=1 Tax=Schizopora paradoxa TaxID=27342 RepID=A0A0H2RLS8_9AGAM|nr:hypothetical protein SCHPADRAFT_711414 [Schizopora paradoxa]
MSDPCPSAKPIRPPSLLFSTLLPLHSKGTSVRLRWLGVDTAPFSLHLSPIPSRLLPLDDAFRARFTDGRLWFRPRLQLSLASLDFSLPALQGKHSKSCPPLTIRRVFGCADRTHVRETQRNEGSGVGRIRCRRRRRFDVTASLVRVLYVASVPVVTIRRRLMLDVFEGWHAVALSSTTTAPCKRHIRLPTPRTRSSTGDP